MAVAPIFTDVSDTPMFRQRVSEMQADVEHVKEGCLRLLKEAKKYCDQIGKMADSNEAFANIVGEFSTNASGQKGEASGQSEFQRFGDVFRALACHHRALHDEIMDFVVEPLKSTWIGQLCSDVSKDKNLLDKRNSAYDMTRVRYLGLKKLTKKEVLKKNEEELKKAKEEAEDARYNMLLKLNEVESRKMFEFLGMMATCTESHLHFFEKGFRKLSEADSLIQWSKEVVNDRRHKMGTRQEALSLLIHEHRTQEKTLAEAEAQAKASREFSPEAASGGPLQMSSDMSGAVCEIESHIQKSLDSQGQDITIIRQGYLHKRSSNIQRSWKKRFFVLDSMGMLYYYSSKGKQHHILHPSKQKQALKGLSMKTCCVKPFEDEDLRFCFCVVSPEKTLFLQAEGDVDKRAWMQSIQAVTACLLNSGMDPSVFITDSSLFMTTSNINPEDWQESPVATSRTQPAILSPARGLSRYYSVHGTSFPSTARQPSHETWVSGSRGAPYQRIRQASGNQFCADCRAPDPEWASLNLGTLICIDCSGIHRQLGSHVSKVRSLKLDVKVWSESVVNIFLELGNDFANSIWECQLDHSTTSSQRDFVGDMWDANSYDDCDIHHIHRRAPSNYGKAGSAGEISLNNGGSSKKPDPSSHLAEKEQFITDKYIARKYCPKTQTPPQQNVWAAVERGDIRALYQAVVCNADVDALHSGHSTELLVSRTHDRVVDLMMGSKTLKSKSRLCATPLLMACMLGNVAMIEFLLLCGADIECLDNYCRRPVHYAVLYEHKSVVRCLLDKGAKIRVGDYENITPNELAHRNGADDEVISWLTPSTRC